MDAAEYKHVVLGLVFLKYISDAFAEAYDRLESERDDGADPEDRDEYLAQNIFWVPSEARWSHLQAQARQPSVGQFVDKAMAAVERDNPALKDVLPKDYARPALDKTRLGQLIDLVGNIRVGDAEARATDVLGRVYDPCCGSSGMFVQSVEFIHAHASGNGNGGRARADISIYGQESNYTTWRLAKMNLAIRGIEGQIAHGDSFHNDRHPDLKADYILANPPFNVSDWGGERLREDKRWCYGAPPAGNANFAWVQHFLHHLAPRGAAGFVLANGSMSSNQSGEGEIRKALIEADLVDCMVALPGQLFYSTQIPACLWFLARDRGEGKHRDRRGEVLFIDARRLGRMLDRTHRELADDDIARIADTYHAWRGEGEAGEYADEPGFCKSAALEGIPRVRTTAPTGCPCARATAASRRWPMISSAVSRLRALPAPPVRPGSSHRIWTSSEGAGQDLRHATGHFHRTDIHNAADVEWATLTCVEHARQLAVAGTTEDAKAGPLAYREKQGPEWEGR